jgi:hypothetical protein
MGRQGGWVRIIEETSRDDNVRINVIAVFMGEAFAFHKQSPIYALFQARPAAAPGLTMPVLLCRR